MPVAFSRANLPSPEVPLAIAVLVLAILAAQYRFRWTGWWERPVARLARKKTLAIMMAALAPLALRVLLLPRFPVPEPRVHDEFSFLLAADTFVHGRLVNPEHPFWVHFESVHIFSRPVYASAFPIAQALALATGKILLGHWWAGVWLSAGFMCGAICWMLQGWLPPRWALLGAVLAVLRFGVSSYWMNSYWGGCLAAAGGALVLGALPRIRREPHWRHAATLGFGLAILANTRTFEGAWLGLIVAVPLVAWMFRTGVVRPVIAPLLLILALTAVCMGLYFARVTGKPWLAPYVLYRNTISVAPHFLWQTPGPAPLYNNRELRNFYVYGEMATFLHARAFFWSELWTKLDEYWRFYVGPLLTIPLLAVPILWRDRRTRQLLLMAAAFSLALVGQVWHLAHYAAPATGLAILIVIEGMRRLRLWRPVGLQIVRCLPVACAVMLLIQITAERTVSNTSGQASWRWPSPGGVARAGILQKLERSGEKHLVFVRYNFSHDTGDEWVYNSADIDGSPVVWARELDRESNAKLMRYFSNRRAWLVEPDAPSPVAMPYQDAPARAMPFVQIGAPGIEVLRSAEQVKRKVLAIAPAEQLSCDGWNYLFTAATGVASPDTVEGCVPAGNRAQSVTFEHWFTWLQRQK